MEHSKNKNEKINTDLSLYPLEEILKKKNYLIKRIIGSGSFGTVYKVASLDGSSYAAKSINMGKSKKANEGVFKEYSILRSLEDEIGFPYVKDLLIKNQTEILIMSLLGSSLQANFEKCGGQFTLKTVLMIGYQAIERIETFHKSGFIHRDIKPENFVIGRNGSGKKIIHLIDFGLSSSYLDEFDNHIEFEKHAHITGTLYYMSVYGHLGIKSTRRDDLISLGFMLIHLFNGHLPWYNVKGTPKEIIQAIYLSKSRLVFKKFCERLPEEFISYFEYVFSLTFFEKPNYSYMKELFSTMMDKNNVYNDGLFDWISNHHEFVQGIDLAARKITCESPNVYMKKNIVSESVEDFSD